MPERAGVIDIAVRPAGEADLLRVNDIFNHYVSTSTCVWTTRLCTEEEREEWFASRCPTIPVLVAERDGVIVGWGALSPFTTACTVHRTVADSIYVHPAFLRQGVGRTLLSELLNAARKADVVSVVAEISADQQASLALHAAAGFRVVGRLQKVGHKFGGYWDLLYLQLQLTDVEPCRRPGHDRGQTRAC